MLVCMHFCLECEQMCLPSQPQQPGIKQKEGVRGRGRGSDDLSLSAAQCHTLGKGKQTVLACGQGGLSRVAWLGQRYHLEQDRKGWQASDRCCSLFSTQKNRKKKKQEEHSESVDSCQASSFPRYYNFNLWYSICTVYCMYRQ